MGKCVVCGKEFKEGFCGDFCSEKCFKQDFWQNALDKDAIIINGVCYHMGSEEDTGVFRGFSGAKFIIEFNDGRKVVTTNLWYQGEIPKKFLKEDNARFVKE